MTLSALGSSTCTAGPSGSGRGVAPTVEALPECRRPPGRDGNDSGVAGVVPNAAAYSTRRSQGWTAATPPDGSPGDGSPSSFNQAEFRRTVRRGPRDKAGNSPLQPGISTCRAPDAPLPRPWTSWAALGSRAARPRPPNVRKRNRLHACDPLAPFAARQLLPNSSTSGECTLARFGPSAGRARAALSQGSRNSPHPTPLSGFGLTPS